MSTTHAEQDEKTPKLSPVDTAEFPVTSEEVLEPSRSTVIVPDGGLQAWLSVLGGWLVLFCTFGNSTSFGVYQDYYERSGSASSSDISWIGSLQLFLLFAMGWPAGRLLDKGYFRHVSIVGTLLFVFSLFMLSLANPQRYYQLVLAQGIGMGIGGGLLLTPALSLQSHHFKRRLALALGIIQSGSSCGGIVYPILVNQLFYGSTGFAWGVRASAFLTLGLLVIASCIMTTRFPAAKDNSSIQQPSMKSIVTDFRYMLSICGLFLVLWGLFFPWFYLQTWVRLHNLSGTLSFYTIAILNAASIFGRIIPNTIADHIGPFTVICPVSYISAALIFAMFGTTKAGPVIVFTILYGFFTGSWLALLPATLSSLARKENEAGIRIGFAFFVVAFPVLTGTPIDGALIGSGDEWYKALLFSGIVMIAGSSILVVARHIVAKEKHTQWI